MKPLGRMTRERFIFKWDEESKQCFKEIKQALVSSPKLCLPDYNKNFVVHTFWNSHSGLYAVLT